MLNRNEQIVLTALQSAGFTPAATAAVMGVVGGESAFKNLKELSYKNTDNSRIRAIFPIRLGSMSDAQLNTLKSNDENFFNAVYGGMYGNALNEGFKYVGRGFNGITFKANYQAAKDKTGIDFVDFPVLLENPIFASKALAAYFEKIKSIKDFEAAFRAAYVENAGAGRSWEFYSTSKNPVHVQGIPLKREKAKHYFSIVKKNYTYIKIGIVLVLIGMAYYYKDAINKAYKKYF